MTAAPEIFDRVKVLDGIESDCLGEGGRSGVLLCSQKVGKTFLLDHIYSRGVLGQATFFCRINMDYLSLRLRSGKDLSDHEFLKFFLEHLYERLEDWVQAQEAERNGWEQGIAKANKQLTDFDTRPESGSRDHRQAVELNLKFLKQRVAELTTLNDMVARTGRVLGQERIKPTDVVALLDKLQRIRKRIVLFIDDYHRMLTEPSFSNDLFMFLRAANNDGKIVTLVSSPIHLMDASLHGSAVERPSLVNHFRVQPIDPFNDTEASGFLDWLSAGGPGLSPKEKAYVRELGGGSPFFLEIALKEFLRRNRPSPAKRPDFEEQYLMPQFEAGFLDIWNRCSRVQRKVLREVAGGKSIATGSREALNLERDGYLLRSGPSARMFSRPFASFVSRRPEEEQESGGGAAKGITTPSSPGVFPSALLASAGADLSIASLTEQDRDCIIELLVNHAASEPGEQRDFFKTLVDRAALPRRWNAQLAGAFNGTVQTNTYALVRWAAGNRDYPEGDRQGDQVLGWLLKTLMEDVGFSDQQSLAQLIVKYNLIKNPKIVADLRRTYGI